MRFSAILSVFALTLGLMYFFNIAQAGELDQEGSVTNVEQRARAEQLPTTVVVRVSDADQSLSVMHSSSELPATPTALPASSFVPMKADAKIQGAAKSELDQDSSTNSWYFYFNSYNYYQPSYYYYGYHYSYTPYYNYSYGGYSYYYYVRPYYGYGRGW